MNKLDMCTKNIADENYAALAKLFPNALTEKIVGYDEKGKAIVEVGKKRLTNVADGFLIACFDSDVTEETVKAVAQEKPDYAVFRDSCMVNDSVATNFEQIFATYSPKTVRKVL